jgi:hypothetical protein
MKYSDRGRVISCVVRKVGRIAVGEPVGPAIAGAGAEEEDEVWEITIAIGVFAFSALPLSTSVDVGGDLLVVEGVAIFAFVETFAALELLPDEKKGVPCVASPWMELSLERRNLVKPSRDMISFSFFSERCVRDWDAGA